MLLSAQLSSHAVAVALAAAAFAWTGLSCMPARSSRFQRTTEGVTVATIMDHGTMGDLQKMAVLKLSNTSQISVTNVPSKNVVRCSPLRNGKAYEQSACTIIEKGKATTRSMK